MTICISAICEDEKKDVVVIDRMIIHAIKSAFLRGRREYIYDKRRLHQVAFAF